MIFRHGFPGKHIGVNAHVVFDSRLVLEIAELFVVYVIKSLVCGGSVCDQNSSVVAGNVFFRGFFFGKDVSAVVFCCYALNVLRNVVWNGVVV